MARKTSKKSKYTWGWAKSDAPQKASDAEKAQVTAIFAPWVAQLKQGIPAIEEPQQHNQVVDIYTRWRAGYFYVMSYYKCPNRPDFIADGFESGVARLTYKAPNCYDVAYFRHTGQWWTFLFDLTLEQSFAAVTSDPIFSI